MITTAIILGLLGSLHCVGMCGPLAIALPIPREKKELGIITYHLGRSLTYGIFGIFLGVIGSALSFAGWQQNFALVMGITLIIFIVYPKLSARFIGEYQHSPFLLKVKKGIGDQFRKRTLRSSFVAGMLNGFLPCGLVYVALAGALSTGEIFDAIQFMIFFGLSTIPALMTIHYLGLSFKSRFPSRWVVPSLSMVVALLFLYRGIAIELPVIENLMLEAGMNNITICNGN